MTQTTGTFYALRPGGHVRLSIRIGSAGLAATDIVVNGQVVIEGHEGHLDLTLGPGAGLDDTRVECYTTVFASPAGTVNRVDYTLTGGAEPWRASLVEDPADPAADHFYADLFLSLPHARPLVWL